MNQFRGKSYLIIQFSFNNAWKFVIQKLYWPFRDINRWNNFLILTESISHNCKPPILWVFLFWTIACGIAFVSLGNLPLRDFDEATVARVALELNQKIGLERLLPSIWDQPYLNKPPGLHWIIPFAIGISRNFQNNFDVLPSEFCIRFFPALF